jgi:hypothetical protein
MKRINLLKFAAIVSVATTVATFSTKTVYAVETKVAVGLCLVGESTCSYTYSDYVRNFYIYSLRLGLALAGIMIMYSGFLYLTSQGDTTKLNKAKEIFTGAALGFFLLISVYAILNFLGL